MQGQRELLQVIHRPRSPGGGARARRRAGQQFHDCVVIFVYGQSQPIAGNLRRENRNDGREVKLHFFACLSGKGDRFGGDVAERLGGRRIRRLRHELDRNFRFGLDADGSPFQSAR